MSDDTSPIILEPTRTAIQVRFSDTDMIGHINNLSFASFTEVGRQDFFRRLGTPVPWGVLAHIELDFHAEAVLGDRVEVETFAERIGNTSLTVGHRVLANDRLVCSCSCVIVFMDLDTRTKLKVPPRWRLPA